jgi:hypothetical protein
MASKANNERKLKINNGNGEALAGAEKMAARNVGGKHNGFFGASTRQRISNDALVRRLCARRRWRRDGIAGITAAMVHDIAMA